MTTLKVHDQSPAASAAPALVGGPITVKDERGRAITLKKPNVIAQFDLIEMLGDASKNETYVNMVLPLLYVEAIDGHTENFNTLRELKALIGRLDNEGLAAVNQGIQEHFISKRTPAEAKVALGK